MLVPEAAPEPLGCSHCMDALGAGVSVLVWLVEVLVSMIVLSLLVVGLAVDVAVDVLLVNTVSPRIPTGRSSRGKEDCPVDAEDSSGPLIGSGKNVTWAMIAAAAEPMVRFCGALLLGFNLPDTADAVIVTETLRCSRLCANRSRRVDSVGMLDGESDGLSDFVGIVVVCFGRSLCSRDGGGGTSKRSAECSNRRCRALCCHGGSSGAVTAAREDEAAPKRLKRPAIGPAAIISSIPIYKVILSIYMANALKFSIMHRGTLVWRTLPFFALSDWALMLFAAAVSLGFAMRAVTPELIGWRAEDALCIA